MAAHPWSRRRPGRRNSCWSPTKRTRSSPGLCLRPGPDPYHWAPGALLRSSTRVSGRIVCGFCMMVHDHSAGMWVVCPSPPANRTSGPLPTGLWVEWRPLPKTCFRGLVDESAPVILPGQPAPGPLQRARPAGVRSRSLPPLPRLPQVCPSPLSLVGSCLGGYRSAEFLSVLLFRTPSCSRCLSNCGSRSLASGKCGPPLPISCDALGRLCPCCLSVRISILFSTHWLLRSRQYKPRLELFGS